jgi:hypothetical protein
MPTPHPPGKKGPPAGEGCSDRKWNWTRITTLLALLAGILAVIKEAIPVLDRFFFGPKVVHFAVLQSVPGGAVTISWETRNAKEVRIDGIGVVPASGRMTLAPGPRSTYALTAVSPKGRWKSETDVVDLTQVKRWMVQESIANYPGNCPCPYSTDARGRKCGAKSAWSKPGGGSPICFESEVTEGMVREYAERRRRDI